MCRWLFVIVIVAILAITATGVIVVDYFGWRGFLVFAVCLCIGLWLLKRSLPRILMTLFSRAMTRPLREMGAVLRGYRVTVHSVLSCDTPVDFENDDDDAESIEDDDRGDDQHDDADEDDSEVTEQLPERLEWYRIDFTLSPPDGEPKVGRIVVRPPWSVSMLGFSRPKGERPPLPMGLSDLRLAADVFDSTFQIWDGAEFVEIDDEVHGEHRLCARVGVGPDVRTIVLIYAHLTEIGEIQLPRIDVTPGPSK